MILRCKWNGKKLNWKTGLDWLCCCEKPRNNPFTSSILSRLEEWCSDLPILKPKIEQEVTRSFKATKWKYIRKPLVFSGILKAYATLLLCYIKCLAVWIKRCATHGCWSVGILAWRGHGWMNERMFRKWRRSHKDLITP